MKKVILIGLSILALILSISCGKDDDPTPNPQPETVEINGFSPASGEVGTEVTITGKNFSATKTENSVTFSGTTATVKEASATTIKVDVPEGASSGSIKVTVGNSSATSTTIFEVLASEPTPSITNISEGEWKWEDEITITGSNFSTTGNKVFINGVEAEILEENETHLKVIVPYGSRTGKITVTRANNGSSIESSEDIIIYHGKWTQIADFGGGIRRNATSFVINGVPYVGLGTDGTLNVSKDFWSYDPNDNIWTNTGLQFPGNGVLGCSSVVINDKAYITQGFQIGGGLFPQMWSFDANTFTEITGFEGETRYLSSAFNIGDAFYFGTGLGDMSVRFKDIWEYNTASEVWSTKEDMGGVDGLPRYSAIGVSLNGKGYIGGGLVHTEMDGEFPVKDFWEYDPNSNSWAPKTDIGGEDAPNRGGPSAFVVNEKIYVGLGQGDDYTYLKDFWEYDPNTDTWTRIADFPGAPRMWATSFVLDGKAYIGTGFDNDEMSDFWVLDLGN